MSSRYERMEWVEIIEPRTKEHMYANLTTGECVWDPPEAVTIKRTDSSQWWELFDSNTQRFYYYNAATQRTVWHRPTKCDIIPLAKLQTLKQNTDPSERKERSTQTSIQTPPHNPKSPFNNAYKEVDNTAEKKVFGSSLPSSKNTKSETPITKTAICRNASISEMKHNMASDVLLSPRALQSTRSIASADVPNYLSLRFKGSFARYNASEKSSDSSTSSAKGKHRFNYADNSSVVAKHLPLISLQNNQNRKVSSSTSGLDHHQQSFPSHISCSADPNHAFELKKKKSAEDMLRKKPMYGQQPRTHFGGVDNGSRSSSQQSFALDNRVGLSRSGSFMSASIGSECSASAYAVKNEHKAVEEKTGTNNLNGGTGSDDDSMHEKYFKSVENTPKTRRHQLTNKFTTTGVDVGNKLDEKSSSDSSAQSSASMQKIKIKNRLYRLKASNSPNNMEAATSTLVDTASHKRRKDDLNSSDILNLESMSLNIKSPVSPQVSDIVCRSSDVDKLSPHNTGAMRNFTSSDNLCSVFTQSSRDSYDSGRYKNKTGRNNFASLDKHSTRRNRSQLDSKKRDKAQKEMNVGEGAHHREDYHLNQSDAEYEAGNTSPLYSNWDQEMQEHLLPIKHYILEQAMLSRSNVFGNAGDSDSYHSESHSDDSLSGHEPDNEDSDGASDTHGTFLEHNYGVIDDYNNRCESAYQYPPYNPSAREHISENVEAVLESIGDNNTEYCKQFNSGKQRQDVFPNKPNPRTPTSYYYDTVEPGTSFSNQKLQNRGIQLSKVQDQTQQHHGRMQFQKNVQKNAVQDYLRLESLEKQKQSQTLPSPNRQTQTRSNGVPVAVEVPDDVNYKRLNLPLYAKDEQKLEQSPITDAEALNQKSITRSSMIKQIFSSVDSITCAGLQSLTYIKDCDIEKFAADNLNLHSKGLFRKKASVRDMLSWTSEAITRPMLALSREKTDKKIAIELFKLVQIYMGDRKARVGMSLNSVAIDIICAAFPQHQLRDELYVQLCRQTTENPKRESLIRGWELIAICLGFLPPSSTFQPTLLNYVNRHRDPSFTMAFPEVGKWPIHVQISHYASVCCLRLERIGTNGRRQAKKPNEEEVELSRSQILRKSMFGNTLLEVMELQKDKFPMRKLPWIQTTLSEHVLLLNGKHTEGIFRVSADVDEVNSLKNRLDLWEVPDFKNSLVEAHTPASLLKLWYRELYDPLIPDEFYEECVNTDNPEKAKKIVQRLPELNRMVLSYLIYFLQQFTLPSVVSCTKMDSANLAMVFAPNCLRCISDDPKIILENARKEMCFIRTLIQHMDTSFVANLV